MSDAIEKVSIIIPTMLGGLPGVSSLVTHQMEKKMAELDIPPGTPLGSATPRAPSCATSTAGCASARFA